MLVNKIKMLCDERGETLASLERKMDFGNGTIRRWDTTTPSGDKLAKIADFFCVTVDYLLGRDVSFTKNEPEITFDDFTYAFYGEAKELTEENKRKLLEMAKFFKQQQNKEKND